MNHRRFVAIALCSLLSIAARGGFATTINVPPDAVPPDATFGSDTQVNLFPGASANVGDVLHLGDSNGPVENTQLNVVGGSAGAVEAWTGSELNVAAGSVKTANLLGSHGSMSGGSVSFWMLFGGSHLEMSGGFAAQIDTAGTTEGNSPNAASFVMTGGEVGILDATGNTTIHGGTVDNFVFRGGGFVEMSGGTIGDDFEVGGVVTGALPDDPTREVVDGSGGHVMLRGGSIGQRTVLRDGRTLDYFGGIIGDSFQALEGSRVNIYGSNFLVDGAPLTLPIGEELILAQRNVALGGVLVDGQAFRFDLNSEPGHGDYFSPAATITLVAVPEPATVYILLLGVFALLSCRRYFQVHKPS